MKKMVLFILVLCLSGCVRPSVSSDVKNEDFDQFLEDVFTQQIQDDLLSMYFTLDDYHAMGLMKPEVSLGEAAYSQNDQDKITEFYEILQTFDVKTLDETQQRIYDNLSFDLPLSLAMMEDESLNFLFRPSTGITSSLNTIFTEYKFKNQERLDDYMMLLKDIDRLLEDALVLTKQQAASGYFLSDETIETTVDTLNRFLENQENHAFILSFNERIKATDFLSEDEKENYISQNKSIVLDEVFPAYQKVRDTLIDLKGSSKIQSGMIDYPNGKKVYETIVHQQSGSMQEIDELYENSKTYIKDLIFSLQILTNREPEALEEYQNYVFKNQEPKDIIQQLMEESGTYFKPGPPIDVEVSYLDEAIANDGISAYYLIPEIDNIQDNVIRINKASNQKNPAGMYLTLAHEGYPGHMYQNTYFLSLNPHPIYSLLQFIGYSEGWAMYSSLFAYDELELKYKTTAEMMKFDVRFGYVVSMIIDLGVNYYGYDIDELTDELYELGLDYRHQKDLLKESIQGVIDEPGQIVPYGAGLMYFDNYLMDVKSELKDDFDIIDYHCMLIEHGPQSFDDLNEDVAQYIKEN